MLFGIATFIGLVGCLVLWSDGRAFNATACVLITLVAVGIWLAGLRNRSHPRLAWALAGCAGLLLVFSDGPIFLLMAFIAVVMLAVECGLRSAVLATLVSGPLLGTTVWLMYGDQTPLFALVLDSAFVMLCLTFALMLGALIRELDRTRATALDANDRLAAANGRLREAMLRERELVLAEERARSSQELHDGLGARLTVTSMSLDYALRLRDRDPGEAWAEVMRAASGNRDALDHMRVWVRALSPPEMRGDVGGAAAFEAIAESFRGTGLRVDIHHSGQTDTLPDEVALLAYRVVQEGLTNALRYAGAEVVTIDIRQTSGEIRIGVCDDGRAGGAPVEGFGLRSLRERAEALGGSMSAGPHPDGGFEVAVVVPLVTSPPVPRGPAPQSRQSPGSQPPSSQSPSDRPSSSRARVARPAASVRPPQEVEPCVPSSSMIRS